MRVLADLAEEYADGVQWAGEWKDG